MIVALHEAPRGFFKTDPPYDSDGLLRFVRKTASLGFKAIEIGPLTDYSSIDGERLRRLLDQQNMKRSVHVGGLFDASSSLQPGAQCMTESDRCLTEQRMWLSSICCVI